MNATDSTKSDVNTQYVDSLKKWNAITEKFEVAFDKRQLTSEAGQALIDLASSIKAVNEYRAVVRIIANHKPMTDQDYKLIKDAINGKFGASKKTIEDDIKGVIKELNASKRKMKQESKMDVHGIQRSVQWVAMGGGDYPAKLDTLTNTQALIDAMGITIKHNIMTRMDEYSGGVADGREQDSAVVRIVSAGKSLEYKSRDIVDHLAEIARDNAYHPVREWLKSAEWDGKSRLQALADTLHSSMDDGLKLTIIKRWAVGAIRAVISDKPQSLQGVMVLCGEQRIGKTTWLLGLCPVEDAVKDGVELNPHNADSVRKATGAWITELGELDGTLRREIAAIKAFINMDSDTYRMPYARTPRKYDRRTAYTASVNDDRYLQDHTGNGRWWTIPVSKIDRHTIDMQQFWAEMRELAQSGEPHNMQREELAALNSHNKAFEVIDTYEELIIDLYGLADSAEGLPLNPMSTTGVAESLIKNPDSRAVQAVGRALKKCGYVQKSVKFGGIPRKMYMMPPKLPAKPDYIQ